MCYQPPHHPLRTSSLTIAAAHTNVGNPLDLLPMTLMQARRPHKHPGASIRHTLDNRHDDIQNDSRPRHDPLMTTYTYTSPFFYIYHRYGTEQCSFSSCLLKAIPFVLKVDIVLGAFPREDTYYWTIQQHSNRIHFPTALSYIEHCSLPVHQIGVITLIKCTICSLRTWVEMLYAII